MQLPTATLYEDALHVFRDFFRGRAKPAFYNFNATYNARNDLRISMTSYLVRNGSILDESLTSSQNTSSYINSLDLVLVCYNGTMFVAFIETGHQWDAPSVWPPHQNILDALVALPPTVTSMPLFTPSDARSTDSLMPAGQIGITDDQLPVRFIASAGNATKAGSAADCNSLNGTIVNGDDTTENEG